MARWAWIGIPGMALLGALASANLHADDNTFTIADLKLRTAGQLVDVCGIPSTHADYVAATAFCYGFFEGAIRYAEAIAGPDRSRTLVCPPAEATRLQAVEAFLAYMKSNPQYAQEGPVDGIYRALMPLWPCPSAQ